MKVNEIVYYCLDAIKAFSDDSYVNEDHILFLLGKYRGALLQQYHNIKKAIPESNYQTICLNMKTAKTIPCIGGPRLVSIETLPSLMPIGKPSILLFNGMESEIIEFVPFQRLKAVGYNRWKKNFIYAALGNDNRLYLVFSNPQAQYIEKLQLKGIFEDYEKALQMACDEPCACNEEECPTENNSVVDGALYLSDVSVDNDGYITVNDNTIPIDSDGNLIVDNIILDNDKYLLEKDINDASYTTPNDINFGIMDKEFPMEVSLIPDLIARVVRDALGMAYRPADLKNNALDDLADIVTYVRRNMKSQYAKQLEGEE